jgi:hypothetical protein
MLAETFSIPTGEFDESFAIVYVPLLPKGNEHAQLLRATRRAMGLGHGGFTTQL